MSASIGSSKADTVSGCPKTINTSGNHRQAMRASRCTHRISPTAVAGAGRNAISSAVSNTAAVAASVIHTCTCADKAAKAKWPSGVKQVNQPAQAANAA